MANITFNNPDYKDKTVYATAGSHTESVLQIAKQNKIPIDFSCEDGNCGTCVIEVLSLDKKNRMSGALTEKEKAVLRELGKLSKDEADKIAVDDMPPRWRLACQMIARDEDVLVKY